MSISARLTTPLQQGWPSEYANEGAGLGHYWRIKDGTGHELSSCGGDPAGRGCHCLCGCMVEQSMTSLFLMVEITALITGSTVESSPTQVKWMSTSGTSLERDVATLVSPSGREAQKSSALLVEQFYMRMGLSMGPFIARLLAMPWSLIFSNRPM